MTNGLPLQGRVAVVTGGASGIGRAICERFAREGARLAVFDIDADRAREVAEQLPGEAVVVTTDVADATSVADAFDAVDDRFGRVDILVNDAGVASVPPGDDEAPFDADLPLAITNGQWDRMLAIHLSGTFYCTRAAVHRMCGEGGGAVVNMGSVAALAGGGIVHYSAAKAGILGFTRAVAQQVGPFGIRVNAVCPGHIDTPMTRAISSEGRDRVIARTPVRRVGEPDDIANAVFWLVSDESSFVTGQWISPNGGLLMQ
jgi:3-oxoacyl-[acyl-carrier protein] reductase